MIVEFVGCTGAGKTSIITEVQQALADTARVSTSYHLLADPFGLGAVDGRVIRNLIQEVIVLPTFVRTLPKNKGIVKYSLEMLKRQPTISISTFNIIRAIERKIGVLEKIKRDSKGHIILVDEGTIHLAHKMFVFSDARYSDDEFARFANLIPLPDLVVYVKAPSKDLVQRTLKRSDPPREIRKNKLQAEIFINRACGMFECILQEDRIQKRLLTIENHGAHEGEIFKVANRVANSILNHETYRKSVGTNPQQLSWKN